MNFVVVLITKYT